MVPHGVFTGGFGARYYSPVFTRIRVLKTSFHDRAGRVPKLTAATCESPDPLSVIVGGVSGRFDEAAELPPLGMLVG